MFSVSSDSSFSSGDSWTSAESLMDWAHSGQSQVQMERTRSLVRLLQHSHLWGLGEMYCSFIGM